MIEPSHAGAFTQLLQKYSGVSFKEATWFKAGGQILQPGGLDYLGSPDIVHAQSIVATLGVQVLSLFATTAQHSILLSISGTAWSVLP